MKKIQLNNDNVAIKAKTFKVGLASAMLVSALALGGCAQSDPSGKGKSCTDTDTGLSQDALNDGDRCSDSD